PGEAPIIVANVIALLQKTFAPEEIANRTRTIRKGDRLNPLDLIEWLEDQGYEPEAQVTQKGDIALRGGIVDIYPLISPWRERLECFGDELESLRYFEPFSQISREEINRVTLAPAGELGIIKRGSTPNPEGANAVQLATLLDFLPRETLVIVSEPDNVEARA